MRKLTVFALVIALILTLSTTALAAAETYDLDELGLEITIPLGYSVITRDTPASDPIFREIGITRAEVMSSFEAGSIYLTAISNMDNEEIVVTMMDNDFVDFNLFSDTELTALASTLGDEFSNYGANVLDYGVYQHSQTKFIKLHYTDAAGTAHSLQYYTTCGGKAVNFVIRSYAGALSSKQKSTIKQVVDSVKFAAAPVLPAPGEDTEPFRYTDADSGVTFTVPANWKEEAFTEEREFIDILFGSTKESSLSMIYGSADMWEQMTAAEKVGCTRADINLAAFTKDEVADFFGVAADQLEAVTYNGVQYYLAETTATSDEYGATISYSLTQLVHIRNGWLYMFQFGGTSESKYYADFESLLNSVQYPGAAATDPANNSPPDPDGSVPGAGAAAAIMLLSVAAVIVVVIVHKKKSAKAAAVDTAAEDPACTVAAAPTSDTAAISDTAQAVFCRQCGQKLPSDSVFCHICGTKIQEKIQDE